MVVETLSPLDFIVVLPIKNLKFEIINYPYEND